MCGLAVNKLYLFRNRDKRYFYIVSGIVMPPPGSIMFPGCPSVCVCVRARVESFSDQLAVDFLFLFSFCVVTLLVSGLA